MEKATLDFRIYKIWQILKHFAGTFRRAQTLKSGGVIHDPTMEMQRKITQQIWIEAEETPL